MSALMRRIERMPTIAQGVVAGLGVLLLLGATALARVWQPTPISAHLVFALLIGGAVAARRTHPAWMLVVVTAVVAVPWWGRDLTHSAAVPVGAAAYLATRNGLRRWAALAVAGPGAVLSQFPEWPDSLLHPEQWYWIVRDEDISTRLLTVAVVVVAAVLGAAAARQRQTNLALLHRNAELQQLRSIDRRQVANDERATIARELHDTVAHHVAAIVLRAQGAERVAAADPDAAVSAVRWIAAAGQEALREMRAIVRVLRVDEDPAVDAASIVDTPFSDALDIVIDRVRASGVPVSSAIAPVTGLSRVQELAVLRVCQEAMTNAVLHAPASTIDVRLDDVDLAAVLQVTDGGTRPADEPSRRGGGNGLDIMRERARLAGGVLTTGSTGAGWTVRLEVPTRHVAHRASTATTAP